MNNKILVFNKKACEEYTLPFTTEGKFQLRIEKEIFGLSGDFFLQMQVLDDSWCFSESRYYTVQKEKEPFFLRKLYEGCMLTIKNRQGEELMLLVGSQSPGIPVYRKYLLDKKEEVQIGKAADNDIQVRGNRLVSGCHAKLVYANGEWVLRNLSSNGIYVNGRRVTDSHCLKYGDSVNLFGVHFVYLKDLFAIKEGESVVIISEKHLHKPDSEKLKWLSVIPVYADESQTDIEFTPAPRILADYDREEFEIEAPPAPRQQKQRSLIMTLGPSLTMAVPMLLGVVLTGLGALGIGLITMVGSAVIGAFWAYMNLKAQKKSMKEDEEERSRKYQEYLERKEAELREQYNFNRHERQRLYPSAAECAQYTWETPGLWNRNQNQEDQFYIRLGVGEFPMPKTIRIPQERFTLINDSLAGEPARIKSLYENLKCVPLGIDLKEYPMIGVIGGEAQEGIYAVLKALIVQIAANLSYMDAKIVLLCDRERIEDRKLLEETKWLPHMWNEEKTFRYAGDCPESVAEVLNALTPVFRRRREEQTAQNGRRDTILFAPWYVVIATDIHLLEDNLVSVFLSDKKHPIGTTTFLCVSEFGELPNACEKMIQNTADFQGIYSVEDARNHWKSVEFDQVESRTLEEFSHRLAAIRMKTPQMRQEIPQVITFLDMYGVNNAQELEIVKRWNVARSYESLRAPIGMRAGGMYCFLDIHENAHGPHGLVAGTTGSGKSEMLQSWILSLAVNFSPADVQFFLIDFKGGGMANQFVKLPHLAGSISNLAGNQVYRALVTIRSENHRRQRIFLEAGVKDIYEYTRLYKNRVVSKPVPHLLIVVDEFAELKKERPEFMSELISVAAIGRSLGVHLILATQKPAGTVDDRIESNTRFRICLKVQDKQDSNDLLKRPDAAYITQTGRGYFRVGTDEILELFQSAWSGASYQADYSDSHDELARLYTVNGRTEIIGTHQKTRRREKERLKWVQKLVCAVEEVLDKVQINSGEYLKNPELLKRTNAVFYEYFRGKEWNILPSAYSDARLLDLVTVFDICRRRKDGRISAEELLRSAQETGRALPENSRKTQLMAVLDTLCTAADTFMQEEPGKLWLPELPSKLTLAEVKGELNVVEDVGLEVAIGRYDDPEHQFQASVTWDVIEQGNLAVYGTIASGKSTFLQTYMYALISRYTPDQVHLYGIDYSSRMMECLQCAPHIGGIINEQSTDMLGKFFYMMQEILAERKQKLKGGSYSQYKRAGGKDLPAIIVVIDQYGAFREKTANVYDTQMLELAREGSASGIYLVLSAGGVGSGEVPLRLAEQFKGSFCLQMNDRYQYRELLKGTRVNVYPEEGVKGRGLMNLHGALLEYQTALAADAENDYQRSEIIERRCKSFRANWKQDGARLIPTIPERPHYTEFAELKQVKRLLMDDRSLPLGYNARSAAVWSLDLSRFYCYMVSGKKRSGKTNFLQMAIRMAALKHGKIYVFGSDGGVLEKTASEAGAAYYSVESDFLSFCTEIRPVLAERNQRKHELECSGYSDEEIYRAMSKEETIYIFIDDLPVFLENLYHPQEGRVKAHTFFETFADKGWYHRIYLFAAVNPDERAQIMGYPFFTYISRDKNGIHLGGSVQSQQMLNFDYLSFKEQSMTQPIGTGLLSSGEGTLSVGKVIIPSARK